MLASPCAGFRTEVLPARAPSTASWASHTTRNAPCLILGRPPRWPHSVDRHPPALCWPWSLLSCSSSPEALRQDRFQVTPGPESLCIQGVRLHVAFGENCASTNCPQPTTLFPKPPCPRDPGLPGDHVSVQLSPPPLSPRPLCLPSIHLLQVRSAAGVRPFC